MLSDVRVNEDLVHVMQETGSSVAEGVTARMMT